MKSAFELREWFSGLPNRLTLARIASIPLLIFLFMFDYQPLRLLGSLVFLVAALTDFFDGFVARRYNMESAVGALLDPVADKLLVLTGLVLLVAADRLASGIAIVLIGREMAISGLRMIALEKHFNIEVSQLGKVKTGFQVAGIFTLMLYESYFQIPFRNIGMLCLLVALGLSLYSAYLYWLEFKKNL